MTNKNLIIAVDFDGTLCENQYPEIGPPKYSVIDRLKEAQEIGAKIILWTCRRGAELADAVYWCAVRGLKFDAINENLKSVIERFGEDTRKIWATEYWDDRAVPICEEHENVWKEGARWIVERIIEGLMDRYNVLKSEAASNLSEGIRAAEIMETIKFIKSIVHKYETDASE